MTRDPAAPALPFERRAARRPELPNLRAAPYPGAPRPRPPPHQPTVSNQYPAKSAANANATTASCSY